MNTTELLKMIYQKLTQLHPRVYLEQAPPGATFPYVVYNLPFTNNDELRDDITLEIDVWDQADDNTVVENLTDTIDRSVHRMKYLGSFQASFYRVNRLQIADTAPRIWRRQLRYDIRTYFV